MLTGIIGLSGYARSGKDSVASILIEDFGYQRYAFADALRDFVLAVNPLVTDGTRVNDLVQEYGWEVAKANPEVRRILQDTGLGARQRFGYDFWVDLATKDCSALDKRVFTDVRFPNEYLAIRENFSGKVFRVERPGVTAINAHESETALDTFVFDHYVHNDGTLDTLRERVHNAMHSLEHTLTVHW